MSERSETNVEVDHVVMVPIRDDDSGNCDPACPFLAPWDHPYYHYNAWCWKQMRDLDWYDYWQADCISNKPDEHLAKYRASGRTKAP